MPPPPPPMYRRVYDGYGDDSAETTIESRAYIKGKDKKDDESYNVDIWLPNQRLWWVVSCGFPLVIFGLVLATLILVVVRLPAAAPAPCSATAVVDPLATIVAELNRFAVDTQVLDHTPPAGDERRIFGHHLGPCRTSRALAIVHLALLETYSALAGAAPVYLSALPPIDGAAVAKDVALSSAARAALIGLYPSHEVGTVPVPSPARV